MPRCAVALVFALSWSGSIRGQALQAASWSSNGSAAGYVMEASGRATDRDGATVSLRCETAAAGTFGSAGSQLAADDIRGRRVSISGELQTRGVTGGASLWLRIDRNATMLMLDNGADHPVRGDAEWTRYSVSLPVPADATTIVFGVLLQGNGSVVARNVRVEASAPLTPDGPLAEPAKETLDAAIAIVKENALRRSEVAWSTVEPHVRAYAAGSQTASDVYPAIRYLLSELGDHHSFLSPPSQTTAMRTGDVQNLEPEVRATGNGVGYVKVPGYQGWEASSLRTYTERFHQLLNAARESSECGWIVDLRQDGGGNMWPMLAGLKPFLGDAPLGTFESPSGSSPAWRAGAGVDVQPPASLAALESSWVAVLTGPRTASSGEAVTIAFRGRPRTRSFGLPTAGLSTANGTFPLPDGAAIFLTTAVEADRTGRRFGDKIEPDQRVDVEPADVGDAAMEAATQWLRASSSCHPGGN
jgi:carboxyl-terminal processing protease